MKSFPNDITIPTELYRGKSLTTIEGCFENMKGDLGLRPNFHHTDTPTNAPVHVTVLAYHILAGIVKKLRTAGIHHDWNTIRNTLATHVRVTTTMNTEDGHVIDVSTCTAPTEKQHTIYHKLPILLVELWLIHPTRYLVTGFVYTIQAVF